MLDRLVTLLGGEDQFKEMPAVQLLEASVQISAKITQNCARLESALDLAVLGPPEGSALENDRGHGHAIRPADYELRG
jgi:hypothetical protein